MIYLRRLAIEDSLKIQQLLLLHYPNPLTLNLCLMVIDPLCRNKGNGFLAYKQLEDWLLVRKMNKVRLGVLFGNEKGMQFWKRIGYEETGEVKPYLSKKFRVLEKHIS